jgi:pimeloyl-ACP methyl ester carboxylesterase
MNAGTSSGVVGGTVRLVQPEHRVGRAEISGHRIAYRVAGQGPALVVLNNARVRTAYLTLLHLLSDHFRVIQIDPLGTGASDRPRDYPYGGVHDHVLAVIDQEEVETFAVWGYSKPGAMAATVAQATSRVAALIVGGFSLVRGGPSDARLARMDREQRVPAMDRAFWHWLKRFDWLDELAAMPCPKLVYFGSEDRTQGPGIRRSRAALTERGVTVIELDGLDHATCMAEPALSTLVRPTIVDWLATVGTGW